MQKIRTCLIALVVCTFNMPIVHAEETQPSSTEESSSDGKWRFGGAVRVRYDYNDYHQERSLSYFGIDTARAEIDYTSSSWFGSMQYRFYGRYYPYQYENTFGRINFPVYAWVGYKFTPEHSLVGGLNMIPFGLPYESSAFYQTVVNLGGLEDTHNLGIRYTYKKDDLYADLGFYPRDGGNWAGTTRDSARYSVNLVKADRDLENGVSNRERNQWVGRLGYVIKHAEDISSDIGVSALYSTLRNDDTKKDGLRRAYGVHYAGQYKGIGLLTQFIRQNMSPRNPGDIGNDHVTMGAFDGAFNVASKGNLYSVELNYAIPYSNDWVKDIKPYLSYSAFEKDKSRFKTSERLITGVQFANGPVFTYVETRWGRNDPYTGDFSDGFAAGGSDKWNQSLHINIGYYF